MREISASVMIIAAACASATGLAQTASTAGDSPAVRAEPGNAEKAHRDQDQAIVVTGVVRRAEDVLGGASVLDQAQLNRQVRTSIGETLARVPGVSATSFGPTASAPVIRGLSGDRVRVLTDGIGTLDLSGSGPDHAISINPITAERIEVLRGPVALLFGSSAIGGVVNVIDTRIPRHEPDGAIAVNAFAQYGSAANERAGNVSVDVPLGRHFVLHADGNLSDSGNLRTGGYLLSSQLRQQAAASADGGIRALAGLKGELPNSASHSAEGAFGFGYVDGPMNIGLAITRHTQKYQVPIRYSLDPAMEPEAPTIDLEQTRYDARAEIPLDGLFNQVRARGGYSSYHHDELADTGAINSSFYSKGAEGRLELVQAEHSGWGGSSGIQYLERSARIRGDEKFLPDARQRQAGLFTLQTYVSGQYRIEAGARVESSKLTAAADAQLGTPDRSRSFTTVSGSLGGQYEIVPGWRAGLSLSHSERAPSVDELFARGPHGGSQSFVSGDPDLRMESGNSAELSLHHTRGPVHITANAFYTRFSNFIFQAPTGAVAQDLPVMQFRQGKATYYGFELQSDAKLGQALDIDWAAEFQADAVHATVTGFGAGPLIPPMRLLGALTGEKGAFDGRVELEHAFAHTRTSPLETATPGYTIVNAALDWHPLASEPQLTLSLVGNNLFDVEARRSTSLLKDHAPLAGRDIRLSARLNF